MLTVLFIKRATDDMSRTARGRIAIEIKWTKMKLKEEEEMRLMGKLGILMAKLHKNKHTYDFME